jgi:predicted metalloprotease with PDZ domain
MDSAQSQQRSLIQASATRFSGANTQVYARGMLVAFLCDIALLQQSKEKRSVEDLLREVFRRHQKPNKPMDGNTAVINLLKANAELVPIVDRYVTGTDKIDWASQLAAAGIEDSDGGPITTLRVNEKPSGRQKTLLDKLGYNNWRKLSQKPK